MAIPPHPERVGEKPASMMQKQNESDPARKKRRQDAESLLGIRKEDRGTNQHRERHT
jgi:hypothetical protein